MRVTNLANNIDKANNTRYIMMGEIPSLVMESQCRKSLEWDWYKFNLDQIGFYENEFKFYLFTLQNT